MARHPHHGRHPMDVRSAHQILDRIAGDLCVLPVDAQKVDAGLRGTSTATGCGMAANVPTRRLLADTVVAKVVHSRPFEKFRPSQTYPQNWPIRASCFRLEIFSGGRSVPRQSGMSAWSRQHPLKGSNRLKLGVFSANADGGLAITDVPERWRAGGRITLPPPRSPTAPGWSSSCPLPAGRDLAARTRFANGLSKPSPGRPRSARRPSRSDYS